MKRVAILQSNYIPWKGYFDIVHDVDLFVFHDDLQYTKNDWRNRNRIKTSSGPAWLTIPVGTSEHRRICDVALPGTGWARTHWRRIEAAYAAAPHFREYREYFESLYLGRTWTTLSELNQALVTGIAHDLLGLTTRFDDSRNYALRQTKSARVLELLARTEAEVYVSGPAAKAYISDREFAERGIRVIWKDYLGYPEYPQPHGAFCHEVSILDVLFHTGASAPWYIWGWRDVRRAKPAA
jgi:hypothetical protein